MFALGARAVECARGDRFEALLERAKTDPEGTAVRILLGNPGDLAAVLAVARAKIAFCPANLLF